MRVSIVEALQGPAGFLFTLSEQWRLGASGMLEVRREGVTTLLYLDEGEPVFAESSALAETLGRVLLLESALTPEQYAEVVRRMTEAIVDAEPMRFGETAVALGFVQPPTILEALSSQVRRRVLACMGPGPQQRHWIPDASIVDEVGSFPQDVPKLLAEGVALLDEHERVALHAMLGRPDPRGPEPDPIAFYGLPPSDARAYRARRELPPDHELLLRLAILDGLTERAAEAEHSRAPVEARPVEARPVEARPVEARPVEARPVDARAEAPAAPRPTRDRRATPPRAVDPEVCADAERERARLRAKVLAQRARPVFPREPPAAAPTPSRRPSAVAQRRRLVAEQAFRSGRSHLEAGRFEPAVRDFERAFELEAEPEIGLHLTFVRWKLGDAEAAKNVERDAKALLRREPENAFAPYVIAHALLDSGDEEKALKAFRRAAQLDPSFRDAERYVRLLSSRLKK